VLMFCVVGAGMAIAGLFGDAHLFVVSLLVAGWATSLIALYRARLRRGLGSVRFRLLRLGLSVSLAAAALLLTRR